MNTKIAIHHRSGSFSDRWIEYCVDNKIPHIIVDSFDNDIIDILKEKNITHFMWHINHSNYRDLMIFPYIITSLKHIGIRCFPDHNTVWHFDDKIAQKYLLESVEAPLIESLVFYNLKDALNSIKTIKLPIVAKLKRGAGSSNVKLLSNDLEAENYIKTMFSNGIPAFGKSTDNLSGKIRLVKKISSPLDIINKVKKFIISSKKERLLRNNEKGYVLFQKFLDKNHYDTRIIVIGDKAFGIRRFVKDNDFKASGSGKIDYNISKIDSNFIKIAFEVSAKLDSQCIAYDFIYDDNQQAKIIEISFGFSMLAYDLCEGYWDKNMKFYSGSFNPQYFMIENLLNER